MITFSSFCALPKSNSFAAGQFWRHELTSHHANFWCHAVEKLLLHERIGRGMFIFPAKTCKTHAELQKHETRDLWRFSTRFVSFRLATLEQQCFVYITNIWRGAPHRRPIFDGGAIRKVGEFQMLPIQVESNCSTFQRRFWVEIKWRKRSIRCDSFAELQKVHC